MVGDVGKKADAHVSSEVSAKAGIGAGLTYWENATQWQKPKHLDHLSVQMRPTPMAVLVHELIEKPIGSSQMTVLVVPSVQYYVLREEDLEEEEHS